MGRPTNTVPSSSNRGSWKAALGRSGPIPILPSALSASLGSATISATSRSCSTGPSRVLMLVVSMPSQQSLCMGLVSVGYLLLVLLSIASAIAICVFCSKSCCTLSVISASKPPLGSPPGASTFVSVVGVPTPRSVKRTGPWGPVCTRNSTFSDGCWYHLIGFIITFPRPSTHLYAVLGAHSAPSRAPRIHHVLHLAAVCCMAAKTLRFGFFSCGVGGWNELAMPSKSC